jgi:hypothetical protein
MAKMERDSAYLRGLRHKALAESVKLFEGAEQAA